MRAETENSLASTHLHRLNWLHVLVQLIVEGDAGGQVDTHDLIVAHVVQMLDDAPQ